MNGLYIRWIGALALGILIGLLGARRYVHDVRAISPERLLNEPSAETVRVLGRVEAGSLVKDPSKGEMVFHLAGEKERLSVRYAGEEPENLRELKTLVIVGRWNRTDGVLEAEKIALIPNYGFVTAAYLVALLPLGFFLFYMERKVAILYTRIKDEKIYQPEESFERQ